MRAHTWSVHMDNPIQAFENMLHEHREIFQKDSQLAKELYSALCNVMWQHEDFEEPYGCSWRYAGGLVASLRSANEDYMSYYCSGFEGVVSSDVRALMGYKGWTPVGYDDEPIKEMNSPLNYHGECTLDEEFVNTLVEKIKSKKEK